MSTPIASGASASAAAAAHSDPRLPLVQAFVQSHAPAYGLRADTLAPASADASFRRYFRVQGAAASYIVMDAPPSHEDCRPFIHVAQLFGATGIQVPRVLEQDLAGGFLLLTDLGRQTYLTALRSEAASASVLYLDALNALVQLQRGTVPDSLPSYDAERLKREMMLFPEWYLDRHLGKPATAEQMKTIDAAFDTILKVNLAEPQVYVHRDYHSRNLMRTAEHNPGVLDFQDAVIGPMSYDLVSLLRDAYIEWPEEQQLDWAVRYWERARTAGLPVREDFGDFWRDFEIMGLQRHLKVLGIFARLYHRDGKDGYLKDIPLVSKYARAVMERYRIFLPLLKILDEAEGYARPTGYTF
jgi:aminoglycoside/choline kinase family phosphotransferase